MRHIQRMSVGLVSLEQCVGWGRNGGKVKLGLRVHID